MSPSCSVSLSPEVLPRIKEYERTSTTVVNAYVGPLIGRSRRPRGVAVRGRVPRRLAADLRHRHHVDPRVLGVARLAAVLRPRGDRSNRPVDDRACHHQRLVVDPHAGGIARAGAGDLHHAARSRGNARAAAHRLHPVCARGGSHEPSRPRPPCAQEHAGAGGHRHRSAVGHPARIRHRDRNRIPVVGHGAPVHSVGVDGGRVGHDRVPDGRGAHLRGRQSRRPLYRSVDPRLRVME